MRDFPLLWALLPLVLLLLVAAWVIARVRRWREEEDKVLSPGDELSHYRELYEQGELEEEEYQRLRSLLGQRLKRELDMPPSPGEEKPQEGTSPPAG